MDSFMDSDVVLKYIMSVFSLSLVLSCCHVVWMVSLFRSYVVTTYVTDYTFDPSSCTVLFLDPHLMAIPLGKYCFSEYTFWKPNKPCYVPATVITISPPTGTWNEPNSLISLNHAKSRQIFSIFKSYVEYCTVQNTTQSADIFNPIVCSCWRVRIV